MLQSVPKWLYELLEESHVFMVGNTAWMLKKYAAMGGRGRKNRKNIKVI